jgi:hypothetical protein
MIKIMKKVSIYILLVSVFALKANAQTGIGTTTPNASAKLDVYSNDKGFLPPRVTLTSATVAAPITLPAEGLLVYNLGSVGLQAGYYYWNGANWATIATASSAGNGVASTDLVKLYGEAYSSATGKIGNTNGYSFTVPVSGRYLFDFSCAGYASSESFTMNFYVRQGTSNLGSDAQTSFNQTIHTEYNGKVEANLQSGVTYNVFVSSTGIRNIYDYDRVYYKMVAGNLPVTGQTVEYGLARYTGADGGSLASGALITFDATAAGNLAWSGNKFTLKANKTYELESSLAIFLSTGGVAGRFQIYDYTNSIALASGLFMSQNGAGTYNPSANSPMKGVVTPATDIQVGVRLLDYYGPAGPGIIGSTSYLGTSASPNASYFMVKQLGSSAIVNPWVLSGNNAYNNTGNVGIGTATPLTKLHVLSGNNNSVYIESTTADNNGMVILNANTSQNWATGWHEFLVFQNQGTTIGQVFQTNASTINYATTSDYRLKTDFKSFRGLDLINKIKTYDYAWKVDSSRMFGVKAHELQAVLPYLVSGKKDEVDKDGKIVPQTVDYGKITPIIIKAIQEQDSIIKVQENKINKLIKEKEVLNKSMIDIQQRLLRLENKKN